MLSFLLLSIIGWNTTCVLDFKADQCDVFFNPLLDPYYDGYRRPPEFHSFEPVIDQARLDPFLASARWEWV
jgi:hypothetical protein